MYCYNYKNICSECRVIILPFFLVLFCRRFVFAPALFAILSTKPSLLKTNLHRNFPLVYPTTYDVCDVFRHLMGACFLLVHYVLTTETLLPNVTETK